MELYEHQELMLAHLRANDHFALFCEMRTGKTLPVLVRLLELNKHGKVGCALIVAPKAACGAWHRDMERFDEEDRERLEGICCVVSYDTVWRREHLRHHWDAIVLDESHKIKNRAAKRTKAILELALDSDYRYILTGTPISNGALQDIWSQFCFLEPYKEKRSVYSAIFGGSYYTFLNEYAYLNQWHQPYRFHNVDRLQDIISEHSFRLKMSDVTEVLESTDIVYDIECKEKARYREMHRNSTLEDADIIAPNGLVKLLHLRQICSGFVSDEQGGVLELSCEKPKALAEFLDGCSGKLVIFAEFTHSIDAIRDVLEEQRVRYTVLDGRTKDKTAAWRTFQEDEGLQVIVCQYLTANAGIDLYAADTMLFYEPTLSCNVLEQAKARITSVDKTNGEYIHFITKNSVEQAIYRALAEYHDFNEQLFEEYIEEYTRGGRYG